jgi:hypothetical protein
MPSISTHAGESSATVSVRGDRAAKRPHRGHGPLAQTIAEQPERVSSKLPRVPTTSGGLAIPFHSKLPELAKLAQHRGAIIPG